MASTEVARANELNAFAIETGREQPLANVLASERLQDRQLILLPPP